MYIYRHIGLCLYICLYIIHLKAPGLERCKIMYLHAWLGICGHVYLLICVCVRVRVYTYA